MAHGTGEKNSVEQKAYQISTAPGAARAAAAPAAGARFATPDTLSSATKGFQSRPENGLEKRRVKTGDGEYAY